MYVIKKPFNDMFGDAVAHDIGLLFEGHRFELRPFDHNIKFP